jgi:formylglycine-generating enzyme required for sulfatase activity
MSWFRFRELSKRSIQRPAEKANSYQMKKQIPIRRQDYLATLRHLARLKCAAFAAFSFCAMQPAFGWEESALKMISPHRDEMFSSGFEVVSEPNSTATATKKMPAGLAKVAAYLEVEGQRYYMTDWSYDRYQNGMSYNWIRPLGGGQTTSPIAAPSGTNYQISGVPAGDTLNIRSGPGANFTVKGEVKNGTGPVAITGELVNNGGAEWAPVSYPGGKGWVRIKYLSLTTPVTQAESPASDRRANSPPTLPSTASGSISSNRREYTNSLEMTFHAVPGTKIFMSRFETQVNEYQSFCTETQRKWKPARFKQLPYHPAVNVSWEDAVDYCKWLTDKDGVEAEGYQYRLPTDHEWSCAVGIGGQEDAKAKPIEKDGRIQGIYPWGKSWPPPNGGVNYSGMEVVTEAGAAAYREAFDGFAPSTYIKDFEDRSLFTGGVEACEPNPLGICGLGGNVWEWCEDYYDSDASFLQKVLRGASWSDSGKTVLNSSYRSRTTYDSKGEFYGFRAVLAPIR